MKKISVAAANARFSEILTMAEGGAEILITRRGAPVARLSGVGSPAKRLRLEAVDAFRSRVGPTRQRSIDLIRRMRDESF